MIKEITPPEAWQLLQAEPPAVLLDVRSKVEFEFVGHPLNAIHVPWSEAPDWQVDADFVSKARAALMQNGADEPEQQTVLMLCRSGARSMAAAKARESEGFSNVINVAEGFEGDKDAENHRGTINGWRFHGLPWEQT